MVAHWRNFLGVFILAIILHSKCNLCKRNESLKFSGCRGDRVYFEKTKKCYITHERGPCAEQMIVEEFEGSGFGVCRCDIPYKNVNQCPVRPMVFLPKYSRCFSLFDQGPCKEGEWLVQSEDENRAISCQVIPCPERYKEQYKNEGYKNGARRNSKFVFAHEGKCYLTQSKDHGNLCKEDEYLYFVGIENIFYRRCSPTDGVCGASSSGDNSCPEGGKPDMHGGCEPTTDF